MGSGCTGEGAGFYLDEQDERDGQDFLDAMCNEIATSLRSSQ